MGDRCTGRGTYRANLGHAIVTKTNGECTASVCDSATVGAAFWGGACGGPRHCCIRWGSTSCKGKGSSGGFLFSIFRMGNAIGSPTMKCTKTVYENLTTFPLRKCIIGKLDSWAFGDIFSFEIKVGVYEKLTKK